MKIKGINKVGWYNSTPYNKNKTKIILYLKQKPKMINREELPAVRATKYWAMLRSIVVDWVKSYYFLPENGEYQINIFLNRDWCIKKLERLWWKINRWLWSVLKNAEKNRLVLKWDNYINNH